MSKRFTDTEKWGKAWFRRLAPKYKCAWTYILDKCDHAGIWHEDLEAMSFNIGEEVNAEEFESIFKGKVVRVDQDKFFIMAFVEYQYGNLNPMNKVHKSVMDKLEKIKVYYKGLPSPINEAKDKDKDKEEDKDKEKEEDKEKEKARVVLKSWNNCDIVIHSESEALLISILNRVEKIDRPIGEVIEAIKNYAAVFHDPGSFFKYRWTLDEFLQRKSAMKFYADSFFPQNFKNKSIGQKRTVSEIAQEQIMNNPFLNEVSA